MPSIGIPRNKICPELARSNPTHKFNNVDLPHPEGPTTVTNSPSSIVRSTFSTASTRLPRAKKSLRTLWIESNATPTLQRCLLQAQCAQAVLAENQLTLSGRKVCLSKLFDRFKVAHRHRIIGPHDYPI